MAPGPDFKDRIRAAGLNPPKRPLISITNGCNLTCRHCWPESGPESIRTPTAPDRLKRLIDDFMRLGADGVTLAGGEPLTHPDLYDILRHCRKRPGIEHICLQTNGTLLNRDHVKQLIALNFPGLEIKVSLDGATAGTNDLVRGEGNFRRALAGLRLLAENGLGPQTCVAFTEMRHNFDEIPELFALLEGAGIGRIISGTLVAAGRAAAAGLRMPAPEQCVNLLRRYRTDETFRRRYDRMGNISAIEWHNGRFQDGGPCCTCMENPYVTADGRLFPCPLLQAEPYAAQDVFRRPLEDVLQNVLPKWAELPKISKGRADAAENCRTCPEKSICNAGCMGRAHAIRGRFDAPEDRCRLRKAIYAETG